MPRFCHVGGVFIDGLDIGGRCGLRGCGDVVASLFSIFLLVFFLGN